MKKWKKYGAFMFAVVMCLSLAACGSSDSIAASSEETENAEGDSEELVTDAASLDGMWSINGGTKLYFDSGGGYYIYRSYYGVGGRGEMSESPEDGKPMMTFNGFMYDFVLRSDGVLMPNQNGDGDGLNIHRNTFKRDDTTKLAEWEANNWDGMWQNAVGETIVIDTANMIYTASSPDYSMDGTLGDEGEGFIFTTMKTVFISVQVKTATVLLCPVSILADTAMMDILTVSSTETVTLRLIQILKMQNSTMAMAPIHGCGTMTA